MLVTLTLKPKLKPVDFQKILNEIIIIRFRFNL